KIEAYLVDGARCHGQVVALCPRGSVGKLDSTAKGLRHALDHRAANEGAPNGAQQSFGRDGGRWFTTPIVLRQKSVDDAGSEQEPIVVADAHDVALDVHQRLVRTLGVCRDETSEQSLRTPAAYTDRIGDGVHGAATQECNLGEVLPFVDVDEPGERDVVGAV